MGARVRLEVAPLRLLPQNDPSLNPSLLPPRKLPQAVAVTDSVAAAVEQALLTDTEIFPLDEPKRKLAILEVRVVEVCVRVLPGGSVQVKEDDTPVARETEYPSVLFEQNALGPVMGLRAIAGATVPLRSFPQNAASLNPSLGPPRKLPQAVAVTASVAVAVVQVLLTRTEIDPLVDPKRKLAIPVERDEEVSVIVVPGGALHK